MSKKKKAFRKVGKRGQKVEQKAQNLVKEAQAITGDFNADEYLAAGIPDDLPPNPYFDSVQENFEYISQIIRDLQTGEE